MRRGRAETERLLVDAAWELLVADGVGAVGVNAVAERAGVDKVLIYRYFGGMPGLLERCGEERDFWPTVDELLGPDRVALRAPPHEAARIVLRAYVDGLRSRPAALAVLAHETAARDELTEALERVRESRSNELFALLTAHGVLAGGDAPMLAALFAAAVNYLVLRERGPATFAGLDLRAEDAWERLVEVMAASLTAAGARGLHAGARP